ncbi:MAG: hypothetical protein AB7O96_09905 [Pseudobdellovibrionaceae bacterium]
MKKLTIALITFFYLGTASATLKCVDMESVSSDAMINKVKLASEMAQSKGMGRIASYSFCGTYISKFKPVKGSVFRLSSYPDIRKGVSTVEVIVYDRPVFSVGAQAGKTVMEFLSNENEFLRLNLGDL